MITTSQVGHYIQEIKKSFSSGNKLSRWPKLPRVVAIHEAFEQTNKPSLDGSSTAIQKSLSVSQARQNATLSLPALPASAFFLPARLYPLVALARGLPVKCPYIQSHPLSSPFTYASHVYATETDGSTNLALTDKPGFQCNRRRGISL